MVTKTKILLSSPHMAGTEQKYIREAFATNWVAPLGANVNGLEEDLEQYLAHDVHAAVLISGTAALHLGLVLLGVSHGDEVLCQSFTFTASANPIIYQGALPVFIDSEEETWNLCPELLEKAIKDRISKGKKPKAIISVHLYGMPYKVKEVHEVAERYDIPILEDSAEALGSSYFGRKCGTFGKMAVLSFNGNKIITSSGGGALLLKDMSSKDKAVFLATQARDHAPHYQHSEIGYNYRMSNIVAGIGRGQMEVLDDRVAARRYNYDFYRSRLNAFDQISFLDEPAGTFANRWLTTITMQTYNERESIRKALMEDDIESRPLWKPLHMQPVFKNCPAYTNGVSEKLFEIGLCLPSGSNLETADLTRTTDIIIKTLR
ncbi:DegT/DnrJ/EryC1/StrS family aminotransferase [Ascidiimonas aurantiaca]|uniref:DegT/DnrJ/EryC1/StrS family aminotransferase n=1 Tax=Ascidiimonas aurantiaca TaxID=1685432 RepID=UPI003BB68EE8